jgi:tRNA(Ile)-lysidine synthase
VSASIQASVRTVLSAHERILLAVSGGLDSSVLLHAAAAVLPRDRVTVATFDHGTGAAATRAAAAVARQARLLGVRCVSARNERPRRTEAGLRDARWTFLRARARELGAQVCTAHTADDQSETVLMRVLRGAGARGLAGLAAPSPVLRPLVTHTRAELEAYAREHQVRWVEDPSNTSRAYLRNRIRHDLLPAMRAMHHSIDADLRAIGERAAQWRRDVEAFVDRAMELHADCHDRADAAAEPLIALEDAALRIVWPAIAARAGATLDRRAIERIAAFTRGARVGARAELAGGWEVVRAREHFELRRSSERRAWATVGAQPLSNLTTWGEWRFVETESALEPSDTWRAVLPNDCALVVRGWRDGDRLRPVGGARDKKVKELLTDAGVTGHRRAGWPVVLAGDQIVWVPGVGRSEAATARPGRPGLPFLCEYIYR